MDDAKVQELAALFESIGKAHHKAFEATDGADPEWPSWYAEHLKSRLSELLGASFTKSELVYLIVSAEKEQAPKRADQADTFLDTVRPFSGTVPGGSAVIGILSGLVNSFRRKTA